MRLQDVSLKDVFQNYTRIYRTVKNNAKAMNNNYKINCSTNIAKPTWEIINEKRWKRSDFVLTDHIISNLFIVCVFFSNVAHTGISKSSTYNPEDLITI